MIWENLRNVVVIGLLVGQPILWALVAIDESLISKASAFAVIAIAGVLGQAALLIWRSRTDAAEQHRIAI